MNDNERFIHLNTKTSHKRLESMVLYALHYSLRDVLIHSQHAVVVDGRNKPYYIDAYLPDLNLAIEVDEPHHKKQLEEDTIREREIMEKIGCRFIRIKCDKSIYEQVDRVIDDVRALVKAHAIDPWHHQPKPIYLRTGEYKERQIQQLEASGVPDLMESLENDLLLEGNEVIHGKKGGIPSKSNGELGFLVKRNKFTFAIYARYTGNVNVRVLDWEDSASKKAIESLHKRQEGKYHALPDNKNGGYRGIEKAKEKFYEFLALTEQ